MPDQEAINEARRASRLEALVAIRALDRVIRADDGLGGAAAIRVAVLSQQVNERVRVYRQTVNIGEEPAQRQWLADIENGKRRGMGRRRRYEL